MNIRESPRKRDALEQNDIVTIVSPGVSDKRHRKIRKCQDRTQPEQTVISVLFLTSISKRAKVLDWFLDVQYILRTSWSCPCAYAEPCLPDLTSSPGESSSDL